MKNQRTAVINTDLLGMIQYWLKFSKPFHGLSKQKQDVLAQFTYQYFILRKVIKSDKLVWKMVFDYDTKIKVKEALGDMPDYTLQNNLTYLRKKNIIKDNRINDSYIPNITDDAKTFSLIYKFNFNEG